MTTQIHYVSAPAGSGKTHQLIQLGISEAAKGNKLMIAQPTMELIDQTRTKLKRANSGILAQSIYKNFEYDTVTRNIMNHMTHAVPDEGEVLLITHPALKLLPKGYRKHWWLAVDEIPSAFEHIDLRIALTHRIVTDHLDASEELIEGITVVKVRDRAQLELLVSESKKDMNVENFLPILRPLLSDDYLVLVDTKSYRDLFDNPSTQGHVDFFTILKPSFVEGFKGVTFLGANAEQTELFVLWEKLFDVRWVRDDAITDQLLYSAHTSGNRLTISYLFDANFSKRHANAVSGETTTLQKIQTFVKRHFANDRFLWHANAMVPDRFFGGEDRLPSVAHGLDREDFRRCNRVVLLSALNRKPAAYAFLEKLGIEGELAHAMIGYQSDYQSMMRCSLRDPKSIAEVEVVVASKGSADWLQARFPNSVTRKLETGIPEARSAGRPLKNDKVMTSTERGRARTARIKAEREAAKAQGLI